MCVCLLFGCFFLHSLHLIFYLWIISLSVMQFLRAAILYIFLIIRRKWLTDCRNYLFIFVVLFFRKNKSDVLVSKLFNSWHGLDLNLGNMISKYFFFCLQFSNSSPSRENGLISVECSVFVLHWTVKFLIFCNRLPQNHVFILCNL